MTDQNEVTVQELAQARKVAADGLAVAIKATKEFSKVALALPENAVMEKASEDAGKLAGAVVGLETKFKAQLVAEYKGSGDEKKKQHPGGSVAIGTKFIYDDSLIIPWLREHSHPELITEGIKKPGVKKLAQAVEVDGVTTEETITPKINTDLSEFLDG